MQNKNNRVQPAEVANGNGKLTAAAQPKMPARHPSAAKQATVGSRKIKGIYLLIAWALLNLFAVLWAVWSVQHSRVLFEQRAVAATQNYAHLLDQNIAGSIKQIDHALLTVTDELEHRLRREGKLVPKEVNDFMRVQQERLAESGVLRVSDAAGTAILGTDVAPAANISFADRAYFLAHRARNDVGMIVTNPILGRVAKIWLVSFSRRYNNPDGSFAGIISLGIPLSYFQRLLSGFDLGPHGLATLRDANLGIIAQHPLSDSPAGAMGAKGSSREFGAAVDSGLASTTYNATQTSDTIARTVTYQRLSAAPFYLTVGVASEDYLQEWTQQVKTTGAATALFMVFTSLAVWLLWRSVKTITSESERRQMLLHSASDGIHILDASGNLIEASPSFAKMLGYTPLELIGMNVAQWDVTHCEQELLQVLSRQFQYQDSVIFETRHRRKDGSIADVEVSSQALTLLGVPVLYNASRDITARKQADLALVGAQGFATATLDAMSAHVCVLDKSGQILAVNQAWHHYGDWSQNPAQPAPNSVGVNYLQLCDDCTGMSSDQAAPMAEGIRRVILGELAEFSLEYPCHSPNEQRWFNARVTGFSDGSGRVVVAHENITRRKNMEDHQRESDRIQLAAVEALDEAFAIYDPQDRLVFCNKKYRATYETSADLLMLGATFEHIIRTGAERGKYAQAVGQVDAWVAERMVHHRASNTAINQRLDDGRTLRILERRTADGYTVGFRVDITELVQATEAAEAANRQLRNLLDAATEVAIIATNTDGLIQVFNRGAERMLGYRADAVVGKVTPILFHLATEVKQRSQELEAESGHAVTGFNVLTRQARQEGLEHREWTYVGESGAQLCVSLVVTTVRGAGGEITGYLGIAQDITEQKTIERALLASESRLRLFFERNGSVMLLVDPASGRIIQANQAASEYYGYSIMALLAMTIDQINIMPAPDVAQERLLAAREERNYFNFSHRLASGEVRDVEVYSSPIEGVEGTLLFSIVHDITHRVTVENKLIELTATLESRVERRTRELEAALELAELAKRSRGAFLANMSHEIRTPMNSVLGMAYLALNTDPTAKQRDYLEKIQHSGEHLLGIINDLLDFSKIDAGKLSLEVGDFDLDKVIGNIRQLTEGKARERGLAMTLDIAPNVARQLRGDALRLGQILINYVNNAVKFTRHGGVVVCVRRQEDPTHGDGCLLRFEVQDSGSGLTDEQMSRLFQPFEQADNSTTRKFGGTGLGLAICKQLAKLMGGEVGVSSRWGIGSTFWLVARFALATKYGAEPAPTQAAQIAIDSLRGAHVLVVDDNAFNLEVAQGVLESVGVQVALASDGAQAINMLRESQFDCVLMDVQMPVMDGLEATRKIRTDAQLNAICIIAMTANAGHEDQAKCLAAGMNDVVTKPFKPEYLFACLAKWLTKRNTAGGAGQMAYAASAMVTPDLDATTIWDSTALARTIGDNPATYRRLLGIFLLGARQQVTAMTEAAAANQFLPVSELAHKLKSSARTVGAMRLGAWCQILEQAKLTKDPAACRAVVAGLIQIFDQTECDITQAIAPASIASLPEDIDENSL